MSRLQSMDYGLQSWKACEVGAWNLLITEFGLQITDLEGMR